MSKIKLTEWGARNYDPPRSPATLRRWNKLGLIFPPAQKHGRDYWVPADARYIPPDDPVLGEIIHGTKSKKPREPASAQ